MVKTVDREHDQIYIQLRPGRTRKSERVKLDAVLDFDAEGKLMGVELLYIPKGDAVDVREEPSKTDWDRLQPDGRRFRE